MPRTIPQSDIDSAKADPKYTGKKFVILIDPRNGDEFLFFVPQMTEYLRFKELALEDTSRARALHIMTTGCGVSPTPSELGPIFMEQPGLADTFGSKLLTEAGTGIAVEVKKV